MAQYHGAVLTEEGSLFFLGSNGNAQAGSAAFGDYLPPTKVGTRGCKMVDCCQTENGAELVRVVCACENFNITCLRRRRSTPRLMTWRL